MNTDYSTTWGKKLMGALNKSSEPEMLSGPDQARRDVADASQYLDEAEEALKEEETLEVQSALHGLRDIVNRWQRALSQEHTQNLAAARGMNEEGTDANRTK